MILGIREEISIFIQAVLTGNFLYLIYLALHTFRKMVKHKNLFVSVEDLAYWGFVGVHLFLRIQKTCSGNLRWYFFLGVLGGSLITYRILCKFIRKHIDKNLE